MIPYVTSGAKGSGCSVSVLCSVLNTRVAAADVDVAVRVAVTRMQ